MKKQVAVKGGLHPSGRRKKPGESPAGRGLLRPDTGALKLPSDLDDARQSSVLPPGIVLIITVLWLLFIAIIIWFVGQMPPKSG